MTFKFKSKYIEFKNFQDVMKKIKIDTNKRVELCNFFELLNINDINIIKKLNHFAK